MSNDTREQYARRMQLIMFDRPTLMADDVRPGVLIWQKRWSSEAPTMGLWAPWSPGIIESVDEKAGTFTIRSLHTMEISHRCYPIARDAIGYSCGDFRIALDSHVRKYILELEATMVRQVTYTQDRLKRVRSVSKKLKLDQKSKKALLPKKRAALLSRVA